MTLASGRTTYLLEDTICAISTELGGAIALVRVTGPLAFEILEKVSQSKELAFKSEPRKMVRSALYTFGGDPLDDAIVVRFISPHSYTGEDMVEFHIHGGHYIAHRLIETLINHGLRQALPGEFSFRSVRNGKLSLFQAQAVADLIGASNDTAIGLALEKISGTQNAFLEKLSSDLRTLAVLGEVGIDFSDQDIDEVSLPHLKKRLDHLIDLLEKLRNSAQRGIRLQDGHKITFIGPPNAGKSSFFNALLGEDRSIVSEVAGTTRDVIREKITLRGRHSTVTLRLEDTAGLRQTQDKIEKIGIERSYQAATSSDVLLFIVDGTADPEVASKEWESFCKTLDPQHKEALLKTTLGILTKIDLLSPEALKKVRVASQKLGILQWVATSALTNDGIDEAVETLVSICENRTKRDPGELLLTRLEHQTAVCAALDHLQRARSAEEIDLFASDIRQALYALAPLIGETLPDDILGQIFSHFCIGK